MGTQNSCKGNKSVTTKEPRVSVGLAVYNGERFIREALDSALRQTFQDFELIISDNASTDGTEEICRAYAARDKRIRYFRNNANLGAARNFNRVVELSRGEYFKFLAADDAIEPHFLERCVSLLDCTPEMNLVSANHIKVNESSETLNLVAYDHDLRSPRARDRFRKFWLHPAGMPIFGVIRTDVLRKTRLMRPFVDADTCLVLELVLRGKFGHIPEYLSRLRKHPDAYHSIQHRRPEAMQGEAETRWFNPHDGSRFVMFNWRSLWEYAKLIMGSEETFVGKMTMLAYLVYPVAYCRKVILIKELFFQVGADPLYIFLRNRARRIIAWRERTARVDLSS